MKTYLNKKDRITDAFEYYYSLGNDRSFEKVAKYFGVALITVKKWSQNYNWADKKLQRDLEVQKRVEERSVDEVVDIKVKYRNDIKAAMAPLRNELNKILSLLKSGKMPEWVKGFNDFERLTRCLERLSKLDLLLLGEATDKQDHEVNVNKTFIDWLADADKRRNSGSD